MHAELKSNDQLRNFVLIYPVYNLEISSDIGGEIVIERVHFISREKIPRVRKRIGLKERISELDRFWQKEHKLPKLFSNSPSYAIIKFKSRSKEEITDPIIKIKDALWILASSQFDRTSKYQNEYFGLPEHQANFFTEFVLYDSQGKGSSRMFRRVSPVMPYKLDKNWKMYLKRHFFFYLLNILNGKTKINVNSKWKYTIRNAAILAGKSHFSKDLDQAFLYNFIAIDTLLSYRGESYPNCLIDRLNALFGWLSGEKREAWKPTLTRLYDLRCKMVHSGDISDIITEDLIKSDNILFNLLYNICRSIRYFPNKQSLIDLSKKVEARIVLGQKITERPNLIYAHVNVNKKRLLKIKKENNWA